MKVCPVCHREYPPGVLECPDDGVPLVALSTDASMRPEDLIGRVIEGRYKIERIIGRGGMGTVYACRHVVVGKVAALKVLKPGVERSEGVLQRFVREAQTANLLRSRHIVEVSDFGQLPNGSFFVVMELLEGRHLAAAMRDGISRADLTHVFVQVAETLLLAHEKGVVHRDLKPDNVFLVNEAGDPLFVKLLDFGIAKILHGDSSSGLTETGVILGTPYYMSPEQARAEAVDHRSDIYSLGVMMYRAFAGRLPFVADSTMGVLTRHITEPPEPPSRLVPMDPATEQLILRCLAKHPEERLQSMREVADALRLLPVGAFVRHAAAPAPPVPGAHSYSAHAVSQSGAFAAPSGGYAMPRGSPAAAPSPVYAPPSGSFPAAPPSGAYAVAPAPRAVATLPSVQVPAEVLSSGETTRGLAATGATRPARAPVSPFALAMGALAMAAIGAVAALLLYHRRPSGDTPASSAAVPSIVTVTVTVTSPAPQLADAAPSASAPAASATTPSPVFRPRAGGQSKPPPAPTATAAAPRPRDIRSPFE